MEGETQQFQLHRLQWTQQCSYRMCQPLDLIRKITTKCLKKQNGRHMRCLLSVWVIWYYQLATCNKSFKADVSKRSKRQLRNSLRWPIYIVNLVDYTKSPYYTRPPTQHHSFFPNLPRLFIFLSVYYESFKHQHATFVSLTTYLPVWLT